MGCEWLLASENTENILTPRAYFDKSSSHFTATNADATSLLTDRKLHRGLQLITLPLIRTPFKSAQSACLLAQTALHIHRAFEFRLTAIFSNNLYICCTFAQECYQLHTNIFMCFGH